MTTIETETWSPMYENENDTDGEYEFEISNFGHVRPKEIWVHLQDVYEISTYGNIKNTDRMCIFKGHKEVYVRCYIGKKSQFVHRLMGQIFLENPHNYKTINHIDGNKHNNAIYNLEWATHSRNTQHAHDTNLIPKLYKSIQQFDLEGNFVRRFEKIDDVVKEYNISKCRIQRVIQGKKDSVDNMVFKYENPVQKIDEKGLDDGFVELYADSKYMIHRDSRIYSRKTNIIMKHYVDNRGYYVVSLKPNQFTVHSLVATQFLDNPENKPFVNHKDGNKLNNHVDNLEWTTAQENTLHAFETGLNTNQIAVNQYNLDGTFIKTYRSMSLACKELGFALGVANNIHDCCKGLIKYAAKFIWKFKDDTSPVIPVTELNEKKAVYRYTLDGKFDKEYESLMKAGEDLGLKYGKTSHITNCCLDKLKTAYNYRWKYASDCKDKSDLEPFNIKDVKTAIYQCDLNGKILKIHESIKHAVKSLGKINRELITACCNGKRKDAYGYGWKFVHTQTEKILNDVKIYKYDLDGKHVGTFDTFTDAALSIGPNKSYISRIRNCCIGNGIYKCKDFYWKFSNEKLVIKINPMNTPVKQYTLDGKYIQTFSSNMEAAKAVGAKNAKQIVSCRQGRKNSAHKFKWV
jgi:hypothetical protein